MIVPRSKKLLAAAISTILAVFALEILTVRAEESGTTVSIAVPVVARGVVESLEDVEISSHTVGVIAAVLVREGDTVHRGQELFHLEEGKIAAQIRQAEARVAEGRAQLRRIKSGSRPEDVEGARAQFRQLEVVWRQASDEFARKNRLFAEKVITEIDHNRAREAMLVAEEQLNGARSKVARVESGERQEDIDAAEAAVQRYIADLSYCQALLQDFRVQSPIDGLVAVRLMEPGESVDVGTPVLRLFNPGKLRVRAELEESDVGKVVAGQAATLTSDAYPGKSFPGKVTVVFPDIRKKRQKNFDPMASFDINTQSLFIQLDDYQGLYNGMTVTVSFAK